ncbi:MAG: hypothetical protein KKB37_08620 [Alphaproteobacteria bacterium]|nr:hypothetical protein [Alphaproteobacteria bacterium]
MALRLTKPWQALTAENAQALPGQLGVYELADGAGRTVAIGFAGARTLFGLRSELMRMVDNPPHGATQFRVEINQQYQTRFRELLMVYRADHGALPPMNAEDPPIDLGRLSPL